LRFNSEMALLLCLLLTSNMVGAVTVLPALVRVLKPRFVLNEHEDEAVGGSERQQSSAAQ
jgi:hypothetical protein